MQYLSFISHPPSFENEDKTRAAALLHFILVSTIFIVLIEILVSILASDRSILLPANLLAFPTLIGLLFLLRSGRVRSSATILIVFLWLIIDYIAYSSTGILDPVFGAQTLTIVIAGLVISGTAGLVVAGLTSAFGLWLMEAANAGQYATNVGSVTVQQAWIVDSAFFTLIALFMLLSMRVIRDAREQAIRNERAQRKSEERYRLLVENAPVTIGTLDRNHRVNFLNRAVIETVESLQQRSVYEFLYPEWHEPYREALNRVFEQGSTEQLEVKAVRPQGEFVWSSIRFAPIHENGQVVEVMVISTDITEQKQAQEALLKRETQYRELFESNPHPMFITDTQTLQFLAVNDIAVEKYGYNRDEFLKMTLKELRPSKETATATTEIERTQWLNVSELPSGIWRQRKKDGSYIFVELSVHGMNYEGRRSTAVTAYDLTSRFQAEEALRRSEAQFSAIYQSVPVSIDISTISDGRILSVNRQFLETMGYSADEATDHLVSEIGLWSPPDQRDEFVRELRLKGSVRGAEGSWRTKSGEIRNKLISIEPIELAGQACLLAIALDITERKRAEEALRASEQQYRQLFEANPHPMAVTDLETLRFLDVNDAALKLYGYSREDFLLLTAASLRVPEVRSVITEEAQKFRTQPPSYVSGVMTQHLKKDGSIVQVEITGHRLNYNGYDAVVSLAYDLTERVMAEEAVRRSEELFSTIFQSVPVAIDISTMREGRVLNANCQFLELTGFEAHEVIGRPIHELEIWFPASQRATFIQEIEANGLVTGIESKWKTKSGNLVDVLISIVPVDIRGEACILAIAVDITERKQAEETIRSSEQLLSTVFKTIPVAIGIVSFAKGQTTIVNDYMLQITGFAEGDIVGRPIAEAPYWIQSDQWKVLSQPIQDEGNANGVEMVWQTKSGALLNMLGSAEQVEIDGEPCLLGVALDITERKQAERIRLDVYKQRELLELKERFIATLSHDFRTPLTVIMSANETLQQYYDRLTPERRAEKFNIVRDQVHFMIRMLEEVLTFNKAQAGKLAFNPTPMNLVYFCQALFEQMQTTDTQHHQFVFADNKQIGDIVGDPNLLQHILVNLLSNAIKYSPEGGEVRFELNRDGDQAVIRISDQGIGIPEDDQKHLFETFYRASNTGTIKGTGLGLAIVKESIEVHGGSIQCISAPGEGTTFVIRLPIAAKI